MAASVTQPLETKFANLPTVNRITLTSVGATQISMQFYLSSSLDAAARDAQAVSETMCVCKLRESGVWFHWRVGVARCV